MYLEKPKHLIIEDWGSSFLACFGESSCMGLLDYSPGKVVWCRVLPARFFWALRNEIDAWQALNQTIFLSVIR
jgi:hypothetical protein